MRAIANSRDLVSRRRCGSRSLIETADVRSLAIVMPVTVSEVAVLRIDERSQARCTTLVLSGSLTNDYIPELERAVGRILSAERAVALNLADLRSVDREGLAFLAGAMDAEVPVEDCPPYVRRWLAQERHTT